jgi:hypothetical protein
MIASYRRKANIACVVFLGFAVWDVVLIGKGNGLYGDNNSPLVPVVAAVCIAFYVLMFWWYIRAKARSGWWMLALILNVLGWVVLVCLSDQAKDGSAPAVQQSPAS